MRTLFKSDALQSEFEENGFVKLSLLDKSQVADLVRAYDGFKDAHEKIDLPYITTSHSNDVKLITAVDEVLLATIAPALEAHLVNYKLLFGNYLVKMPVANSATPPHQDITFVDEKEFTSVNIWIALQDIDEGNGSMYFLKGSHKYMFTIRPTHHYDWVYENVKKEIERRSVTFSARAGEAFVFAHSVVHGSHANGATSPRLAAVMAAYSKDAPLIHYYLPQIGSDRLEKYAMDKEAYLHFEKEKPPLKGVLIGEEKFDFTPLSIEEFDRISGRRPMGIIDKIKGLLSIGK
jgi:hypothetical protein